MLVKTSIKRTRKVLIEKFKPSSVTIQDLFEELTDNCKISYDPVYKSRFFLVKKNKIILSITTHGKNLTIVGTKNLYDYFLLKKYNIKINQQRLHYNEVFTAQKYVTKEIKNFLAKYEYSFKHHAFVAYNISHKDLIYLNKKDNVVLKTKNLWFSYK